MILWAASEHVSGTLADIQNQAGELVYPVGYKPMGQLIKEQLGTAAYSVGFISGGGSTGPAGVHLGAVPAPIPILFPPITGWDRLFLSAGFSNAFIDFRGLNPADAATAGVRRLAGVYHYGTYTAEWPRVFDGFFFTGVMNPATRAP